MNEKGIEFLLALHERLLYAASRMSEEEKRELLEWESKYVTGNDDGLKTSDWPKWKELIAKYSQ
jgi:enolase